MYVEIIKRKMEHVVPLGNYSILDMVLMFLSIMSVNSAKMNADVNIILLIDMDLGKIMVILMIIEKLVVVQMEMTDISMKNMIMNVKKLMMK